MWLVKEVWEKTFALGKGKETQYFYTTPTAVELHRLFGSQMGNATHYQKHMVVDPNGQVSVSYLDQAGQVVATALAGKTPDNLHALQSLSTASMTTPLKTGEDFDPLTGIRRSVNVIANVIENTNYTINYDVTGAVLNLGGNCTSCEYEYRIYVLDPEGKLVPSSSGMPLNMAWKASYQYTCRLCCRRNRFYSKR